IQGGARRAADRTPQRGFPGLSRNRLDKLSIELRTDPAFNAIRAAPSLLNDLLDPGVAHKGSPKDRQPIAADRIILILRQMPEAQASGIWNDSREKFDGFTEPR